MFISFSNTTPCIYNILANQVYKPFHAYLFSVGKALKKYFCHFSKKKNPNAALYKFLNFIFLFEAVKSGKIAMPKDEKSWKAELTEEPYQVLRKRGEEPAFTGKYWDNKEKGIYKCAGCGQRLFSSKEKFDSGTGWPSFTEAIPGAVEFHQDNSFFMKRTEAICSKCKGHLGHIFPDGPKEKGGKRFCINSCSLDFKLLGSRKK